MEFMNAKPDFSSCDVDALFKAGYQDCLFVFWILYFFLQNGLNSDITIFGV